MRDEQVDLNRRRLLAAGAVVLAAPLTGVSVAMASDTDQGDGLKPGDPTPKSPEDIGAFEAKIQLGATAEAGPLALFAPLGLGDEIGFGWRIEAVRAPERGALLVALANDDGGKGRVHVCRNPGCAAGIASTDEYDFLLMNDGHGAEQTDEDLGRAVVALAALAGQSGVSVSGLLSHEERIERWVGKEPGALL